MPFRTFLSIALCLLCAQCFAQQQSQEKITFVPAAKQLGDLSEEQETRISEMYKRASVAQRELHKSVGLTKEMVQTRKEAYQKFNNLKGAERNAKADKEAGFNEAQITARKKVGEAYRLFRYKSMQILSEDQRSRMPKWIRDDFAASKKKAEQQSK